MADAITQLLFTIRHSTEQALMLGRVEGDQRGAENMLTALAAIRDAADERILAEPAPPRRAAQMLAEFHRVFGGPGTLTDDPDLRPALHAEEQEELREAFLSGDREQIARELADLVYVAYGSALVHGIDLDTALVEVHRANMSKLDTDGQPIVRLDGKVLKGPGFQPPNMQAALRPAA